MTPSHREEALKVKVTPTRSLDPQLYTTNEDTAQYEGHFGDFEIGKPVLKKNKKSPKSAALILDRAGSLKLRISATHDE